MSETAAYAWIIDLDHLAEEWGTPVDESEVGTSGPHDAPGELLALLGEPRRNGAQPQHLPANVRKFRLYDDDGELYYTGRQAFVDPAEADEDAEFGPLNDFGMPNDGAVRLDYWEDGEWKTL